MPPRSTQEILSEFRTRRAGQPSLVQEGQRLQQEAGIPQLRQAQQATRQSILGTQRLLRDVPQNVQARTRRLGGPVSQFALQRLTGAAQQPLTRQLGELGQQQQAAASDIAGAQTGVNQLLDLLRGQRGEERQSFLTELDVAGRREAQQAQASAQAAALQAQREAEANRNAFLQQQLQLQQQALGLGDQLSVRLGEEAGTRNLGTELGGIGSGLLNILGGTGNFRQRIASRFQQADPQQIADAAIRLGIGDNVTAAGVSQRLNQINPTLVRQGPLQLGNITIDPRTGRPSIRR